MKISQRHGERTAKPVSDWKDSRLIVAVLTAAGTATFMITVVLPISTASLNAKIESLEARIESLTPAEEKIKGLQTELSSAKKSLGEAQASLLAATENSPFAPGSAYPTGFDKVVIGDTAEDVLKAYRRGSVATCDPLGREVTAESTFSTHFTRRFRRCMTCASGPTSTTLRAT